ncbi:MAG: hypothetical protein HY614_01515 [Candidatus Rokubacteria bacterium]|nr:hypothetical protein [Candidatus Rokubacteria bacterium]
MLLVALAFMAGVLHGAADASGPFVVTQALADLDGDGRPDAIAVQMMNGRRYVDDMPWCGMSVGGTPKYEGRFVLRVTLAGRSPVDTDLNGLFNERGDMWSTATPGRSRRLERRLPSHRAWLSPHLVRQLARLGVLRGVRVGRERAPVPASERGARSMSRGSAPR